MKKRSARGKITRESVMDAALAVADRDGFDAVSLRAIAAEVGATPMALYTYFSGKDALYAGMRDRALARATDGRISRRTWQSMLEEMGRGIYRVMREHPHWMPLVAQGSSFPPSGLPLIEELLALMLTDGFVLEDALCAYGCVMSFAVGSVQFERIMTGAGDVAAKRLAFLKALGRTPGPYANLASVAAKVDRWRWDDVVEFGFESLLTGIEAKYARPERRLRGRPRAT